ncbi:MAG: 16S rRNA (uracil(1498)-N(3))-methyltransferase [Blastocatellia bacterium]|nr:16S rRNA (uracil(1498)-N(3))-methyltransferase [Blastocatellia bacterium]
MTIHRFYLPGDLDTGQELPLAEEEAHHARNVLRLATDNEILVFDGTGREFSSIIAGVEKKRVTVRIGAEKFNRRESSLEITLAVALIKPERFEWILQKAVELGVKTLVPLVTEFTEKGLVRQENTNRRLRWERIALEATKQCERAVLMQIEPPVSFSAQFPLAADRLGVMLVERDAGNWKTVTGKVAPTPSKITLFIGPEGGWSTSERMLAVEQQNVLQTTLGPRILRAETAALTAISLTQAAWGDF